MISSVLDEAFALLVVLYNKNHVWVDNMRNGEQSIDSKDEGDSNKRKKQQRKDFVILAAEKDRDRN